MKKQYYKILSDDMVNNKFQYRMGLNTDTVNVPFGTGNIFGLYFSDAEHIFEYFRQNHFRTDCDSKIAEVEIPKNEPVISVGNEFKTRSLIIKSVRPIWTPGTFYWMIEKGINFRAGEDAALMKASIFGCTEIVKILLKNGYIPKDKKDKAFTLAAANGRTDVVKLFFSHGANVHAENDDAILSASAAGHTDVVKILLERKIDPFIKDRALIVAAANGQTETARLLIKNGANVHAQHDEAIYKAAVGDHTSVFQMLLQNGADVRWKKNCMLRTASANGNLTMVKLLLERGADPHSEHDLAIRWAEEKGHTEVVHYLTEWMKTH